MEKSGPGKSKSFREQFSFKKNDQRSAAPEKSSSLSKSSSFSAHKDRRVPPPPQRAWSSIASIWNIRAAKFDPDIEVKDKENNHVHEHDSHQPTMEEISLEVDGFIKTLSMIEDPSNLPKIPPYVDSFAKMVEGLIGRYDCGASRLKFGQDSEMDTTFSNALSRLSKLSTFLEKFSSNEKVSMPFSLTSSVLQRAMTFMEDELRVLLEEPMKRNKTPKKIKYEHEDTTPMDQNSLEENVDEYPGFSEETMSNMKRIASTMINAGFETECCQVYSILRRKAFKDAMIKHGLEKVSTDDVKKMQWEPLEGHIMNWIKAVKLVAKVLLPGEKHLCDAVFSKEQPSIGEAMITNLARAAVIFFLGFAEAIAETKRSAERLFKVLDMYESLTQLMEALDHASVCSHESSNELRSEISSVRKRLGEAAVCIFCDLENSIKNDAAKNSVPTGAVHPLTRYTMNYLRYACDFKETLEQVFSLHQIDEPRSEPLESRRDKEDKHQHEHHHHHHHHHEESSEHEVTPFAAELMTIMNLLDANLEAKSQLYKDPSLRFIFLMNNGRYIMQKIKASTEINELVGDDNRRKRSSELRGYHKSYQRETWSRVLQCLNQEGMQVNGKIQKPVLKERFKSFNHMFDEIHKTQSAWVVSDEQLQSELRVSISSVMIPAYRSFLARFGQFFSAGRQRERYVKYQPEDIEAAIERLFDGNQNLSISKRKH